MSEAALEDVAPEAIEPVDAPEAVETDAVEPVAQEPQVDVRELQAELEFVRNQNAQIVNYLQSQGQTRDEAQATATAHTGFDPASLVDEFGNIDLQAFARYQADRDQNLLSQIDQRFSKLDERDQQAQVSANIAKGEELMRDVIADDIAKHGELLIGGDEITNKIISEVRNTYFPEMSARYGNTDKAAELAIERAVAAERDYQKRIGDTAIERHVNRNAELAGVKGEPGVGAPGIQTRPEGVYRPGELARKFGGNADRLRFGT